MYLPVDCHSQGGSEPNSTTLAILEGSVECHSVDERGYEYRARQNISNPIPLISTAYKCDQGPVVARIIHLLPDNKQLVRVSYPISLILTISQNLTRLSINLKFCSICSLKF